MVQTALVPHLQIEAILEPRMQNIMIAIKGGWTREGQRKQATQPLRECCNSFSCCGGIKCDDIFLEVQKTKSED